MKARVLASTLVTLALFLALAAKPVLAAPKPNDPMRPVLTERVCGTAQPTAEATERLFQAIESYRKSHPTGEQAAGGPIKIAWHVIYSGATGNVPQSQIDAQIAYLNRAYSGKLGGANTHFTFVLSSVDRTDNHQWFTMLPGNAKERNAKQALAIDIPHRLNVYSCAPGQGLIGWAYFPNDFPEGDWHHGVVIHYGTLPGGYLAPYNLGGTLAHETGHYLGLYHTFQGGCTGSGDFVSDTPAEATPTSGCPEGKNTCPSPGDDPIHNFMDYSSDACYTEFTAGQDDRMDAIVPVYRPSLLGAALVAGHVAPMARGAAVGTGLAFRGAYPNPFTKSTTMVFTLPKTGDVSLRLYNVAGQLVATLIDGERAAGEQSVTLDKGGLPPGMYFATLRYDGSMLSRSVILVP